MIAADKNLDLTVHTSLSDINPADWDALVLKMREPTIYHSYDWTRIWMEHFAPDCSPHLIAIRDGGRLVGLLPMIKRQQRLKFFRRLRFMPISSASLPAPQYLGPICAPENEDHFADIFAYLFLQNIGVDAVFFENFLPGQAAEKVVDCLARRTPRGRVTRWTGETTYWVPLANTFDEFWQTLPRKLKKNIVSARNRFAATEGARIELVTGIDACRLAITAFRNHSIARLGEQGIDSTLADERMCKFFLELTRVCFDTDRGIYLAAFLAEKCIGTIFALRMGPYLCYYNGSFDPEYSSLSPGTLLIDALCKEAIARGHRKLDMLAGFGEYKHRWAGENCAPLHHASLPIHRFRSLPFTLWEKHKARKAGHEIQANHDTE